MHGSLRFLLVACVLVVQTIPCWAKLGEKLESCASSYGKELYPQGNHAADGTYLFKKDNYLISVTIMKGVVVSELIIKNDKSTFTEEEKKTILKDEGGNWIKDPRQSNKTIDSWYRDDGSSASYVAGTNGGFWFNAGFSKWPLNQTGDSVTPSPSSTSKGSLVK